MASLYVPNLTGLGLLTTPAGVLVRGPHGETVPVATDANTGKRWQRICERTPGASEKERTAEIARLRAAGAVHISSQNSAMCGWWELVNETDPAYAPPPAAPANAQ